VISLVNYSVSAHMNHYAFKQKIPPVSGHGHKMTPTPYAGKQPKSLSYLEPEEVDCICSQEMAREVGNSYAGREVASFSGTLLSR